MRIWRRLLVGCLLLVLLLVAGVAVFLITVDPNDYRGTLARVVEDLTGRRLAITGDLRVVVWPRPSVEAHGITFANADWATEPDMLRLERVRAEFALLPLFGGRLVVRSVVAVAPRVLLEVDENGRPNWEFAKTQEARAPETTPGKPRSGLAVTVDEVRIEDGGLDYVDLARGTRLRADLERLRVGSDRPGGQARVDMQGAYQGVPITLEGRLGEADAIFADAPVRLELEGTAGDAVVQLRGDIDKPLEVRGVRLDLALDADSTRTITDALGLGLEELGPVALTATLSEEAGQFHLENLAASARPFGTEADVGGSIRSFEFDVATWSAPQAPQSTPMRVNLEGRLGEARWRVDGEIGMPLEAKDARLAVNVATPTTRPLTELAGVDYEEVGPARLDVIVSRGDGAIDFENIDLEARPRKAVATVKGSVKNLDLLAPRGEPQTEPARVDLSGSLGEATFSAAGSIDDPLQARGLRLDVALKAKSTKALTGLARIDLEEIGPVEAKLRIIEEGGRLDLAGIDALASPRSAEVVVKGSVADVTGQPKPDVDVVLTAKTLQQLGAEMPDVGPVRLSARVRPRDRVIEVRNLVAHVGKSDLSGTVSVDMGGGKPRATAKLHAGLIDLAEFRPAKATESTGAGEAKATASEPGGAGSAPARRIFPDNPLPLDALGKADGDVALVVDRLVTRKLTLDKVDVAAKLQDGKLTLEPAAHLAGGKLGATLDVDAHTRPAKFSAHVDATQVSIGALNKEIRGYEASTGLDSNLAVTLRGQGASVRDLMAGLNGDLRLEIGEGQLKNDMLDKVGADLLTQVLGIAVPSEDKEGRTHLVCGVVRFKVVDGIAVADQTLVLETDKVRLKGGGLVNLKTEELDLGARLAAREGIRIGAGTLSSLAKLQGTLGNPRLGTDLTGLVTTSAKVGVAVVTAGLSLVAEGVYGHLSEDKHPCQTALARTIEVTPKTDRKQEAAKEN